MTTDNLSIYTIESEAEGIGEDSGIPWGRRVLRMADGEFAAVKAAGYLAASVDNKWPGASGLYAKCIHSYQARRYPGLRGYWQVIVEYRPPTMEMILQPGRGLLKLDAASEQRQVYRAGVSATVGSPETGYYLIQRSLVKGHGTTPMPRGLLNLVCADVAAKETAIYKEALGWIGKSNKKKLPKILGVEIGQLMSLGGRMRRRPSHLGILDLVYSFAYDEDSFDYVTQQKAMYFPANGTSMTEWVSFGDPRTGTTAVGEADFTKLQNYLNWLYT